MKFLCLFFQFNKISYVCILNDLQIEMSEFAEKFNREDYQNYEDSLKYYRDMKNSLDNAREEGRENEKIEIAKRLIQANVDLNIISMTTGTR